MTLRSAIFAITAALALSACEDKETAFARCKIEALRDLTSAATNDHLLSQHIRSCMRLAGFKTPVCTSYFGLANWPSCYEPTGVIAKALERVGGGG